MAFWSERQLTQFVSQGQTGGPEQAVYPCGSQRLLPAHLYQFQRLCSRKGGQGGEIIRDLGLHLE